MKEKNWEECLSENSAVVSRKDVKKANSLLKTAGGRIKFLEKQKVEHESANYVFEGFYTSMLELLQSLVIARGYKVLNHICLGYYLRDELKREDLFRIFDDLRYKRNSLVYYGREMDFETSKDSIEKAKRFIKESGKLLHIP